MNAIETSHLSKNYGGKAVLDNVSISIREGEVYGLVGRNGAGKTTLIRCILGLATPSGGEIKINGATSENALNYERQKIGSLIDSPALVMHLSGLDNLKAAALAFGHYDVARLKELMHKVGLNPEERMAVKNYSLGMKQRLAIAIALIGEPRILILDEPVNGLDPAGIFEVRELIQRLNHEEKVTILISSHLLSELGKVANSYGIIEGGRLVKELRSSDLEELCRPYIKVVVGDLKVALNVVVENYHAHDFEILPYNTLALYDLSKDIPTVAQMFAKANVPVINIYKCEGDLESTFISLMGGLGRSDSGEQRDKVFEDLDVRKPKRSDDSKQETHEDTRPLEEEINEPSEANVEEHVEEPIEQNSEETAEQNLEEQAEQNPEEADVEKDAEGGNDEE